MEKPISIYKEFIDGLVDISPSAEANRVRENAFLKTEKFQNVNKLLDKLTVEEKELLGVFFQEVREGGIHDTLVYLQDKINSEGLVLVQNEVKLANEPYGTEMYYDWVSRKEGDDWPE